MNVTKLFWNELYARGKDSGPGSKGRLAEFKAEVINRIMDDEDVHTILDFGCGDGMMTELYNIDDRKYIGIDISTEAIKKCLSVEHGDDVFMTYDEWIYVSPPGLFDCVLSVDVLFHIIEDDLFHDYMTMLFDASSNVVVIYAYDSNEKPHPDSIKQPKHMKYRKFTNWIDSNISGFKLIEHIPNRYPFIIGDKNTSISDFYIYKRKESDV